MTSTTILDRASALGFDSVGIVPLEPPRRLPFFESWLDEGMHGEMAYMARRRDLRADPRRLQPGALSAVVVAMSHNPRADDLEPGGIARYARGKDYHKLMRKRLAELGRFVDSQMGARQVGFRPFVDSAPILERDLAERAGIGWFGKNSNIISQTLGSYLFLGELFVDRELEPIRHPAPDRCGRCTACLDACPTRAIVAPYTVDSRRCISYLTIEIRGAIPAALRPLMGTHLFGCDICQIVCPWNRKAPPLREPAFEPRPHVTGSTAADVLQLTNRQFEQRFSGTAVMRTGRDGLARNAAVALGNSGDPGAAVKLAEALRDDRSPLVRGHAAWALGRLSATSARRALESARGREPDDSVRLEIERALS